MGVCYCSMFCCTLLYVHSSIAIIFIGKRKLVVLLNLSSWCLVMVEWLRCAIGLSAVCDCGISGLYPRGGGGTLIFSAYVGSDPTSTLHRKKNIRNFKHPKKIFKILAPQKNILISVP